MNDLRVILRSKTASAHAQLDLALGEYNLTRRSDLSNYLRVHYLARLHLEDIFSTKEMRLSNQQKLNAIQSDFEVLGAELPQRMKRNNISSYHPIGLTYVMAGSSLGSKVLYKRWTASTDVIVQRAGKFITNAKDNSEWVVFLAHIGSLKVSQNEIDDIVLSANDVFEIYKTANDQVKESR